VDSSPPIHTQEGEADPKSRPSFTHYFCDRALISSTDGRQIAWHNGGTGGFRSFVGYDPKGRIGVVVLSNAFTLAGVDDIGFHLLNPKLPFAHPEPPKQHTELHIDPKLLDNYTGRYQVTPDLILEITRDGDRLSAQACAQIGGQVVVLPKFELFAEGEKNFFARVSDQQITFLKLAPTAEPPALFCTRPAATCLPPDYLDSRLHLGFGRQYPWDWFLARHTGC